MKFESRQGRAGFRSLPGPLLPADCGGQRVHRRKTKSTEDALRRAVLEKAYYAPGHGVLYEVKPDWTPRMMKHGRPADWVTTEAMDIAREALLPLDEKELW